MKYLSLKQRCGFLLAKPVLNQPIILPSVLRKIVIWRKVCFGTWSENGSRYLERVMTVVATCRLQERSVFRFLRDSVQAHLDGMNPPSLLPANATF